MVASEPQERACEDKSTGRLGPGCRALLGVELAGAGVAVGRQPRRDTARGHAWGYGLQMRPC